MGIGRALKRILLPAILPALLCAGCHDVDDERIPALPVNINLTDPGMWHTYGVAGYGISRRFIKQLGEPAGFPYLDRTLTGFGGVLLIGGMDPFTTDTNVPLAYDLSCPVERKADVRVRIDPDNFEAVCPVCGSVYDVTMAAGAPLSGPALKSKFGLSRYSCIPRGGGYLITN